LAVAVVVAIAFLREKVRIENDAVDFVIPGR
jgi:hypothetical protein